MILYFIFQLCAFTIRTPTPEPIGPGDKSTISWQPFNQNNLTFAYLSSDPEVKIDYRQKDYAYWREYLRYITHGETFFLEAEGSGKTVIKLLWGSLCMFVDIENIDISIK